MKPDSVWNLKSSQIQYIVLKSSMAKKNVHLEFIHIEARLGACNNFQIIDVCNNHQKLPA